MRGRVKRTPNTNGKPAVSVPEIQEKPSGECKGVVLEEAFGLQTRSFSAAASSYSAAAILPCLGDSSSMLDFIEFNIESYIRLVINNGIQTAFIVGMYLITIDAWESFEEGSCDGELMNLLYFPCLWTHIVFCLLDVWETCHMWQYLIKYIPTVELSVDQTWKFEKMQSQNGDEDIHMVAGGFTKFRKCCIVLFILVPKIVIASTLIAVGGMYLSASDSNADLFLNTLALVFVLEMDEILFTFFSRKRSKMFLEAVPAFVRKEHEKKTEQLKIGIIVLDPIGKLVLSMALVAIFTLYSPRCGAPSGSMGAAVQPYGRYSSSDANSHVSGHG